MRQDLVSLGTYIILVLLFKGADGDKYGAFLTLEIAKFAQANIAQIPHAGKSTNNSISLA